MSDEDLCKMLAESRKGGSKIARLKTFPVSLKMEISKGNRESLMRFASDGSLLVKKEFFGKI